MVSAQDASEAMAGVFLIPGDVTGVHISAGDMTWVFISGKAMTEVHISAGDMAGVFTSGKSVTEGVSKASVLNVSKVSLHLHQRVQELSAPAALCPRSPCSCSDVSKASLHLQRRVKGFSAPAAMSKASLHRQLRIQGSLHLQYRHKSLWTVLIIIKTFGSFVVITYIQESGRHQGYHKCVVIVQTIVSV